ncbi:GNAT family N-acetyltransferase [Vibrio parahaemolyticus]|uniref:GNAT family N-acetyltransferase n=1 Tax=Vibrio parahaemolyticus TaxID=670 RepID=UPI00111F7FFE|nr:GNAT family N-acetyltransferase [Vibrio parahaemolyticus]TOG07341.1 GNAT family N-acetyltransferase [Vibrio parahaemolyticus]HBC3980289.1 GNAT family N-acetyltransferase [Vibrio parahaemolyticus]HCE2343243.1 GNAT family N-acetyltransferase [Vibrio parahaemolyticus]HCE4653401.1 GNAT family N-acetyltransferase [Vibrio parahaemolyticus]HCG9485169.1 GNAT family N-acetyltransferase [Vibrio parahaemolyticus]
MKFEIRKIQESDIQGFHKALTSVASEGQYLLTTPPVPFGKIESFIKDNIAQNYAQYVALKDGEVIGWADIMPSSRNTMSHVGSLGMGVVAPFRGQGVGKKLLINVIEHAWSQGLTRLELEVFSDNTTAIEMYKKHGYMVEGTKKFARFYEEKYQDIILMAQYRT